MFIHLSPPFDYQFEDIKSLHTLRRQLLPTNPLSNDVQNMKRPVKQRSHAFLIHILNPSMVKEEGKKAMQRTCMTWFLTSPSLPGHSLEERQRQRERIGGQRDPRCQKPVGYNTGGYCVDDLF